MSETATIETRRPTARAKPAEAILRQRAKGMAETGCVTKDGPMYRVRQPCPVSSEAVYHQVTRGESGRVVCTCEDFIEFGDLYAAFRCEHIFAVIFFVKSHVAGAQEEAERIARGHVFPKDPLARSFAELVSTTQLSRIRAAARTVGVNPDLECRRLLNCNTEDLSKDAAEAFIGYLEDRAGAVYG